MYFPDGYAGFGAAFRWAVRTSGNPDAIANAVRSALSEQDRTPAAHRAAHLAVVSWTNTSRRRDSR